MAVDLDSTVVGGQFSCESSLFEPASWMFAMLDLEILELLQDADYKRKHYDYYDEALRAVTKFQTQIRQIWFLKLLGCLLCAWGNFKSNTSWFSFPVQSMIRGSACSTARYHQALAII